MQYEGLGFRISSWTESEHKCVYEDRYCNVPGILNAEFTVWLHKSITALLYYRRVWLRLSGEHLLLRSLSCGLLSHWKSNSLRNRIKQESRHTSKRCETWSTYEHKQGRWSDRGSISRQSQTMRHYILGKKKTTWIVQLHE